MNRILVVDSLASFLAEQRLPAGIETVIFGESSGVPEGTFSGIVPVVTTRIGQVEMDRARGLRVIANYGVGYDNIDLKAARERGVAISNTPGVLTDATAELTWALILATARRVGEGERLVRSGRWTGWQPTQLRGVGLSGKALGIIGAGRIGRAVGARAAAFGMRTLYWSRSRHIKWEAESGARYAELGELLADCDVVSIHLPKSADTERLIDARALARLQDGAILINTSRGAVIDEQALIAELATGRISAGLDVYVDEPRVPDELLELENVVLLPHLGSATSEARQAMWDLAWRNLLLGIRGEPLLNPV